MTRLQITLTALFFSTTLLAFDEVEVTPLFPNGWEAVNVRDDAMVMQSNNQPLFGDGSLLFATDTVTNGQDKADFQLLWQQSASVIDFPGRTLGNISDLNYAWYRDAASTTIAHFTPVFRLTFYDDNNTPTDLTDDVSGVLVWEGVYNGYSDPVEDSWELVDMMADNFWAFVSFNGQNTGTGVIQNYNVSLDDWINQSPQGQPGDPQINLSADTLIIGVNVGVGSGWGNSFLGYVDAVRVGFGEEDDTLFNFEVCPVFIANDNPDVIFDDSFECFKRF
ncbi:hypothetical protein OS175_07900 [Marinicella sp. S1101]|uniref:hypothetical protein n=1 Tax=Marinicella marina TaxID=2996016 RepID=UPI002260F8A2|nr:hypothetical protein [Marinicella marina]MCX7553797.1 hypothetical protein [Marinicella marina]MDJ1140873.1 hypothetical protein [Marinicella marina]